MDPRRQFGARLRELRNRAGMTQQQLGEAAGVSYKFLGSTERGEENPTLSTIAKLAAALGIEPRELFEFRHLDDPAQLQVEAKEMIDRIAPGRRGTGGDTEQLRLLHRVIRAVVGPEVKGPESKRPR